MTYVQRSLNEFDEIQELWTVDEKGHTAATGSFDFASRVKDNILAFFNIGGRLGVMSIICTSSDDDDSVNAILQAYSEQEQEPVELLEYVVLIDYDWHLPPHEHVATIYRWEPGSPTEKEVRHDLITVVRETDSVVRAAMGVGTFAGLPLDNTTEDFLKHTKLL